MSMAKMPTRDRAEYMRAYRAARRIIGRRVASGRGGKHRSKFDTYSFIGIDGEGWDVGPARTASLDETDGLLDIACGKYQWREHVYSLLAASDGSELYRGGARLGLEECLDYLCAVQARNRKAIMCIYGGSYDIIQILIHAFDRDTLHRISAGDVVYHRSDSAIYRIVYRARKCLTVWKFDGERVRTRARGNPASPRYELAPDAKFVLWDVIGFFQSPFLDAMQKWLPLDSPEWKDDYALILRMKPLRDSFGPHMIEEMRVYNQAEMRVLVAIMERLRGAIAHLGLKIARWDGAGAVAAAMYKEHGVKESKRDTEHSDADVFMAARRAYSGGHIECLALGAWHDTSYDYDVNSAYPTFIAQCPCLSHGRWIKSTHRNRQEPPPGFTMVQIRYRFRPGNTFYPLFYRAGQTITYPRNGAGIYWYPEYLAAQSFVAQHGAEQFEIEVWWHWQQDCDHQPFAWVRQYYDTRQKWVGLIKSGHANGSLQWIAGAQLIIKLGLNSLYGKMAQQVGYRKDPKTGAVTLPPYFQLEWAGYVTACTRARLMQAALLDPSAIVMFATDGLFTTRPLPLECAPGKPLGGWELTETPGVTLVQAGVYFQHSEEHRPKFRGFDYDSFPDRFQIYEAWKKKREYYPCHCSRVVGIGSASVSETYFQMRGAFVKAARNLDLTGHSNKRDGVSGASYSGRLAKSLVFTTPAANYTFDAVGELSYPYPIAWVDGASEKPGQELPGEDLHDE